jgi:hypothetical protein
MPDYERKTKIVRIFGRSDKTGDQDVEDVWIEVECGVGIHTEQGGGLGFQRLANSYLDIEDKRGIAQSRKIRDIKLYNPDGDKSVWIPFPVTWDTDMESGGGLRFNHITWELDNSPPNEGRDVTINRVYHFDGDLSAMSPSDRVIPLDDERVDKEQYIDVEVVQTFSIETGGGLKFQRTKISLDTQDIPGAHEDIQRRKAVTKDSVDQ